MGLRSGLAGPAFNLPRASPSAHHRPRTARAQFTALIERAKRSIHIIDHKLDDPAIEGLLKSKKAQGVAIRVLGEGQLGGLQAHGKLMIVDGKIAAIGSMAQTALGLDFRREIAVTIEDPSCLRKLKDFYRQLAAGRQMIPRERAMAFVKRKGSND